MSRKFDNPSELGPWGRDIDFAFQIEEYNNKKEDNSNFCLPRMVNKPTIYPTKLMKTKEKSGWPMKINPLRLEFEHKKH